jgi:non-homologous end joining protein Ku
MMDANFSLKRLSRKEELTGYEVEEEKRVWVSQEELKTVAEEDAKFKEAAAKKGKTSASLKVKDILTLLHVSISKNSLIV